jgi:hypothetical protein
MRAVLPSDRRENGTVPPRPTRAYQAHKSAHIIAWGMYHRAAALRSVPLSGLAHQLPDVTRRRLIDRDLEGARTRPTAWQQCCAESRTLAELHRSVKKPRRAARAFDRAHVCNNRGAR